MKTIDADMAIAELQRVVNDRGEDYVYDGGMPCAYVHNNNAACAVGVLLHNVGVSIDALRKLDITGSIDQANVDFFNQRHAEDVETTDHQDILKAEGFHITRDACAVLFEFQVQQDIRTEYGECLRRALDVREGCENV